MATATIFKGFNQPVENRALMLIIKDIKAAKYKTEVEEIRSLIQQGSTEKADQLKKLLPAFTPSGTFEGGRKADLLTMYSGYVHLDLDKLKPDQFSDAFQKITEIPYTFACFRSPGGNGLKVFIEVSSTADHHDKAYKQVQTFYESELALLCDPKCKDITRLCFVSYDPDTYLNIHSQKFQVEGIPTEIPPMEPKSSPNSGEDLGGGQLLTEKPPVSGEELFLQNLFLQCIKFTEQKETYHSGNRNNFIYLLACNCNRNGIPEESALDLITTQFDLSINEITSSVKSAYHHHQSEFANSANFATLQTLNDEAEEDYLKTTPIISDEIYNQLPELLKSAAMAFTVNRERDVFLTGALSIISGCLPNVKGVYAQQTVYPNLYSFIIAPAASGKGALKFAKNLADNYHDSVLQSSKDAQQQYLIELSDHKIKERAKKKTEPAEEPPKQPPFKVVFIPANSSYAKILFHLEQNEGAGIICETEADTMGNVLKQEWGGYSDMLRKAFHHERVSSSKKANNEYIEVNELRLSVALSGTPIQVTGLIASAEDGLFSRFMFYAYKVDQLWHDVSPDANEINLTDHFSTLSDQVHQMVQFLEQSQLTVSLSRIQWAKLNDTFRIWLADVAAFVADEAGSIVKRLGLITYRMAMIFTAIRKFENNDNSESIDCTLTDFETALQLSYIYLKHSLLMFHNLPNQTENRVFRSGNNKRKFYEALPDEFKRADAIEIGKTFNLSVRTVDLMLKQMLNTYLFKDRTGYYNKSPKE